MVGQQRSTIGRVAPGIVFLMISVLGAASVTPATGASEAGAPSASNVVLTGPPLDVVVVARNESVVVSWQAAAPGPGDVITGYTATALPGGASCTWTTGPLTCTILGLTNGTAYTVTARATGNFGFGPDSPTSASVTPTRFTDVPVSSPFYENITWLVTHGVTTGYDDGTFRPTAPVTRMAAAAQLYRLASLVNGNGPAPACTVAPFTDVSISSPFCGEIHYLADHLIINGFPDGTFRPTVAVSRQAVAAFLYRSIGSPNGANPTCAFPAFTDVPVGAPFCGEIQWLVTHAIAAGYGDGTYRPLVAVSRQAMAAFLHRFYFAIGT